MKVKMILSAAMNHVLQTCVIGATNKCSDIKKTRGWVFFSQTRYNYSGTYVKQPDRSWAYVSDDITSTAYTALEFTQTDPQQDPLNDPKFSLQEIHKEVLLLALLTQEKRAGNCHARCCVLAKYLWENSAFIHRIELLEFNFDHFVVVVNRTGDLYNPSTWGDALIVDCWHPEGGSIYPASEFIRNTRETSKYIKSDYLKQYQWGLSGRLGIIMETDWDTLSWECYAEIVPSKHLYPTYQHSPLSRLEDYYVANNAYTNNVAFTIPEAQSVHKSKFQDCLTELKIKNP